MSFLSKVELKKQLQAWGVKVEGNYVRKKDVEKIVASLTTKDKQILKQLEKLIRDEHIDSCSGCDINDAFESGYHLWAIHLFRSSGATSKEFNQLYSQLSPAFRKESDKEGDEYAAELG